MKHKYRILREEERGERERGERKGNINIHVCTRREKWSEEGGKRRKGRKREGGGTRQYYQEILLIILTEHCIQAPFLSLHTQQSRFHLLA